MCGSGYVCSTEKVTEREAMKRRSVVGERLDGRLAGEVMDAVGHKEMAHALEAYQSQHVGRCGDDDANVQGDVVQCMYVGRPGWLWLG